MNSRAGRGLGATVTRSLIALCFAGLLAGCRSPHCQDGTQIESRTYTVTTTVMWFTGAVWVPMQLPMEHTVFFCRDAAGNESDPDWR